MKKKDDDYVKMIEQKESEEKEKYEAFLKKLMDGEAEKFKIDSEKKSFEESNELLKAKLIQKEDEL